MSSAVLASQPSEAATTATTARPRGIVYLGMDVHKDSITIAVLPTGAKSPDRVDRIPNDLAKLRKFLQREATRGDLRCCYEASGAGFVIHRALRDWGYVSDVIAPSLIPTRPGVQRKHDKRDAVELARLYRAGELIAVRVPSDSEERVRDVVRCRETFQREVLRSRHYILKFLARRGQVFREGANWRTPHRRWLQQLGSESSALEPPDRMVFREYLALLDYKLARREELDREIERLADLPEVKPAVRWLQAFRGIALHSAMVLATEIVDWRRFERPSQLAAYLGLVPREESTGSRARRGSITKAGNRFCRHVLIEAAWHYHYRPNLSQEIKRRQVGLPASVVSTSWKAQQRLHKRFVHLSYRKDRRIAVVGVARELVAFLWAVMRELPAADDAARSSGREVTGTE
jgi:transposase